MHPFLYSPVSIIVAKSLKSRDRQLLSIRSITKCYITTTEKFKRIFLAKIGLYLSQYWAFVQNMNVLAFRCNTLPKRNKIRDRLSLVAILEWCLNICSLSSQSSFVIKGSKWDVGNISVFYSKNSRDLCCLLFTCKAYSHVNKVCCGYTANFLSRSILK